MLHSFLELPIHSQIINLLANVFHRYAPIGSPDLLCLPDGDAFFSVDS